MMDMVNFGLNVTDITSSQLINLVNNPVMILENQKDSILLPHRIVCCYFFGTINYYAESSNLIIGLSDLTFGLLDPGIFSSNVNSSSLINVSDCQKVITDTLINQPLLFKNLGQDLSNGNGSLKMFVWYSTIAF